MITWRRLAIIDDLVFALGHVDLGAFEEAAREQHNHDVVEVPRRSPPPDPVHSGLSGRFVGRWVRRVLLW